MAYRNLQHFIRELEQSGELVRIREPVSPELEITAIVDRVVKAGGPALLFENPLWPGNDKKNPEMGTTPVLINAFGSMRRMAMALGRQSVEEIAREIEQLIRLKPPRGIVDKMKMLSLFSRLADCAPKLVKSGPCQEVVYEEDKASLDAFPILKCWPGDGGRFLTLPCVFTKDPHTGVRNVGMYRMQVYDERTTGMHWHQHKVGAKHYAEYERLGRRMPVAVSLGGDPAITYSATAPLPEDFDEMILAGFIRREPVEMVRCRTIEMEVPAEAEIVIEGYVEPHERRREGPFGDHTGYYSLADNYPVFRVTCISFRKNPIYPCTIVGRPPMEDCFMAKATERIFLPLIRMQLPEIVDINLPMEGVFHNLAIVSIKKRFPGHARKVMHALWGLGQMSFTKIIVVVDEDVDVQDISEVIWRVGNNIDPKRDIEIVEGPVDVLNHAAATPGLGSKMGIDATRPWPGEGYEREWPPDMVMTPEVQAKADDLLRRLGLWDMPVN